MTLAEGVVKYGLGTAPVTGCGIIWTIEELDKALEGPVAQVFFDDKGKDDLRRLLESVPNAGFNSSEVRRILEDTNEPEEWRVGEALAESYLVYHRSCMFPWPDGRDQRKSGSSLPGADLVGFQRDGESECFVFGEVKTSGEDKYPPRAMYGETGFKKQLEDLRDEVDIRNDLVKYLGHRAMKAPWKDRFKAASARYLADHRDVKLFGLLIRDVSPHENDIRARVNKLSKDCPPRMSIELIAIYLPLGSIGTLVKKIVNPRKGDAS